jgi:hypothetical protein
MPVQVFVSLGAIVVCIAQRLKLAENEQVPIAFMWNHVVDHCCDRGDAVFCAHAAERFGCQLQLAQALPSACFVERQPLACAASGAVPVHGRRRRYRRSSGLRARARNASLTILSSLH